MGVQFVWSHRAPCLEGPHTRADALLLLLESSQHFLNLCLHLNLHLHFANYVTDPGLSLIISILTTHSAPLAALFAEEDSKVAYDMGAWVSEPEPSQRAPRAWELHLTGLTPRKFCFLGPWICTLLGSLSYPLPFLLGGVKPRPPHRPARAPGAPLWDQPGPVLSQIPLTKEDQEQHQRPGARR